MSLQPTEQELDAYLAAGLRGDQSVFAPPPAPSGGMPGERGFDKALLGLACLRPGEYGPIGLHVDQMPRPRDRRVIRGAVSSSPHLTPITFPRRWLQRG